VPNRPVVPGIAVGPDVENPAPEEPGSPAPAPSEIPGGDTPAVGFDGKAAWSLLSLRMSIFAVLIALTLILARIVRRRDLEEEGEEVEEDSEEKKRRNAFVTRTLTVIFGVLTPIVFLILDDMRLPMTWINRWTLYVGFTFLVHIVLLIVYKFRNKKGDSYESEQGPGG
jgi:amino acid transporter